MSEPQPRTHAELQELVPAHALGALDPEDAARLEAHLGDCADCRAALHAAADVVALLAAAAAGPAPPPALRARILRAAARSARLRRAAWAGRRAADWPRRGVANWPRPSVANWPRRAAAIGLAAAAILAGVVAVETRIDGARPTRVAALAGASGAPVGDVVREGDGAGLVLPPLPPLPPGRTYQAWAIVGDAAPVSLGLVAPGARVALARGAEADVLAISIEPAGGSAQPTTAPVFSAELA